MKKLFFIVLIVVLLMVIGSFAKEALRNRAAAGAKNEPVALVEGCDCNVELGCADDDKECMDKMLACGCEAADADEENGKLEDVEEDNPELTSDDGETVIQE